MATALATLTNSFAARFGLESNQQELVETLKATAFKGGNVTYAQMTALMLVAQQYNLNPWTREIYAFPDKGGIVPVVGVDGWSRIMNDHPQFDGMEFKQDDESCTCIIYRKDRSHAIAATEYMAECKRNNAGPWQSHPRRMLRHKAMIQCARLAFGFGGIYDQDEAERIVEGGNVIDGSTGEIVKRTTPQSAVSATMPDGYDDYEASTLPLLQEAAKQGTQSLQDTYAKLDKSKCKSAIWVKHSVALKDAAGTADFVNVPEEVAL